ncbi:hypothetical protein JI76_28535 [Streptomyces anulatus]|uniref:hypothetical protein n=1 Tax=Streptomyces anulatus TaxID=1892 RepID=UPI0006DB8D71|nr:hypothetical protein [Streptomyces anulatus]KPL29072.1 hypothetical protein JI76_28535 [Streptomyces anulatus]
MAITPKKDTPDSGVLQEKPDPAAAKAGDHDRIVMASRRADGSMDQVAPEFIGDKDVAIAAAKEQLAQQAASAVDVAARGVSSTPEGEGSSEPDPDIAALKKAQDKAIETAESQAEREVNGLHQGLGD